MRRDVSKRFQKWTAILATGVLLMGCNAGPEDLGEDGAGMEPIQLKTTEQAVTYGEHDYLFVVTPKTWQEAQTYCANNGYSLVTINDAGEEAFLHDQERMRRLPISDWWIGYNDRGIEGWWNWASGASSHVNWYPAEPNDAGGSEDCAADGFQGSGQWNDWPCTQQFPFICERDSYSDFEHAFIYEASNTNSAEVNTVNKAVHLFEGMVFTASTCARPIPGWEYGDSYLRILDPNGVRIAFNDDAGGPCGLKSDISLVAPVTGTYTIMAGCFGNSACRYMVAYDYD
jgi:hypothetical protein